VITVPLSASRHRTAPLGFSRALMLPGSASRTSLCPSRGFRRRRPTPRALGWLRTGGFRFAASAVPRRLTSLVLLPHGRPRAVAGPLPYELFENILDLMNADVETLRSCTLFHSTWRGPFQGRLFRAITLDHDMAWPGLLNVLETSSHLRLLIRNICLIRGSKADPLPLTHCCPTSTRWRSAVSMLIQSLFKHSRLCGH
jgi:hypothetical protein